MIPDEVFQYTTVSKVRPSVPASLTDEDILDFIRIASSHINRVTSRWFSPVRLQERITGSGLYVAFANRIPIIRVETLSLVDGFGNGTPFTRDEYFIPEGRGRVDFRYEDENSWDGWVAKGFGELAGGVNFVGYVGYIDPILNYEISRDVIPLSSVTAAVLTSSSTSIKMTSVDGVKPWHYVIVEGASAHWVALVKSVDTVMKEVVIDAPLGDLPSDIEVGATTKVFGRVPRLIERAARRLATKLANESLNVSAIPGSGSGVPPSDLIIEERTEAYYYRLAAPSGGNPTENSNTTGDAVVDNWISNFMAGPSVEIV